MQKLASSRVAVFGIGGVGGYVIEALARSGIGALDLVDDDRICLTNINRQILATRKTVGAYKVDVAAERLQDIHPGCRVRTYKTFFLPETEEQFDFSAFDYVADAIDTVTGKLRLIEKAHASGIPIISAMGAGNKRDAGALRVADLYETVNCPLARVMRRECRKRGISALKVVYSPEEPIRPQEEDANPCRTACVCPPEVTRTCLDRRDIPGSLATVPAVAGLLMAGEILNDLINNEQKGLQNEI